MKPRIAHFVFDEKFTDAAFKLFEEAAPGCSDYYLPSFSQTKKYIKKTPVKVINRYTFKNQIFMRKLKNYDFVVLHSLTKFNQELISHSDEKIKFVWIGMGYDYYDLIYPSEDSLYDDYTKKLLENLELKKNKKKNDILKQVFRKLVYHNDSKRKLIERIDYFAPVLEDEYHMISSQFKYRFPQYINWNYGSSAEFVSTEIVNEITGKNILLGNSADPTNNHIKMINLLKNKNLKSIEIICPLSYGDSKYADAIESIGKESLNTNFVPIRNFLSFNDYMNIIKNCSNVIMNHVRQQGGGNITSMIYLGAKVFLSPMNPFYKFYCSKGVKLFTIDELFSNFEMVDLCLSETQIRRNRDIIKFLWGKQAAKRKTHILIDKILS